MTHIGLVALSALFTGIATEPSPRPTWRHLRTCTNTQGETFHRGSPGFHDCVEELKRADADEKTSDQKAGTFSPFESP